MTRRLRLSLDDVTPAGEGNPWARHALFEALARHAPRRLAELVAIVTAPDVDDPPPGGVFDLDTEHALQRWAQTVGLPYSDARWMAPIRLAAMTWRLDLAPRTHWPAVGVSYRGLHWPTLAPWRATEETERAFRQRVERYIEAVKALPSTQRAQATFTAADFDAFVLEHVEGCSFSEILDRLGSDDGDDSAPRKRNSQIAQLLGLRLRRRARGRPARR